MNEHILEIIDRALALAGYDIGDHNGSSVVIRNSEMDQDWVITVEELPG